jgi:hypothetical protein
MHNKKINKGTQIIFISIFNNMMKNIDKKTFWIKNDFVQL